MIIPKLSGNINLCNFKRLPKFERCGLSLLTATPTVPRLMPHPVELIFCTESFYCKGTLANMVISQKLHIQSLESFVALYNMYKLLLCPIMPL